MSFDKELTRGTLGNDGASGLGRWVTGMPRAVVGETVNTVTDRVEKIIHVKEKEVINNRIQPWEIPRFINWILTFIYNDK